MKKLMILAFAMAFAVSANAAKAKWTVTEGYTTSGSLAENYIVYFFDSADVSRANMISAMSSADTLATYMANYAGTGVKLDEDGYGTGFGKTTTYGNPQDITGYLVIFDAESVADARNAFISAEMTKATGATSGQNASFGFGKLTDMKSAANWTTVGGDVPEPTSAMLLLLGVAGLALKRRRA